MKKKTLKILMIIIIALIVIIGIVFLLNRNEPDDKNDENKENSALESVLLPGKNPTIETPEEQQEVEEVKEKTGKTGDANLYEVHEVDENTKIATIKSSVKYKVAFAGIIKNGKPDMKEVDNIMEEHHPEFAGIYVVEKDRDKFLQYLEGVTNTEYYIDNNGYLKIGKKNNQNEYDKKLEKAIKGEKLLYIINISSVCYIVDEITGEILDYSFENLDKYQTYEYFDDADKRIIFITENKQKQLDDDEIINSVIDLL